VALFAGASRVPSAVGSRVISTVVEPARTGIPPSSQPQVKTSRLGGSTVRKRPEAMFSPVTRVRYEPPGSKENVPSAPIQDSHFSRSVRTPEGLSGLPSPDQLRQELTGARHDQDLADAQQCHWQSTYTTHPGMYRERPSDPAVHAAAVFHTAGANDVLELGAGHGRDALSVKMSPVTPTMHMTHTGKSAGQASVFTAFAGFSGFTGSRIATHST
jgi:hypothetical protein